MATAELLWDGQAIGVFLGIVVVVVVVVVAGTVVVVAGIVVVVLGTVVVEVLIVVVVVVVGRVVVTQPLGSVVVGASAGLFSADVAVEVVTMKSAAPTKMRSGPRRIRWITRRVTPRTYNSWKRSRCTSDEILRRHYGMMSISTLCRSSRCE